MNQQTHSNSANAAANAAANANANANTAAAVAETSQPPVLVRVEARAGRLTLNRPKVIHALNYDMCRLMFDALMAWKGDPAIDLVIVDHLPGSRGFCAGGDVRMISASGSKDGVEAARFFELEYNLNCLIKNYPKPYVPIMNGITMGGGKGIAIFGSHRVASENSVLAMPEGNIGLFPDVGGGWFLPRLRGELGTWMALTGARVTGLDTIATQIATHFCPANDLDALVTRLASDGIAALNGLQTTADVSSKDCEDIIDRCFAHDSVERIVEALEAEGDQWAADQAKAIRAKCPTTAKVALRQLRQGRQATDFAQWMGVEYRIGCRMCRRADFAEGVRAVLIDKDHAPKWTPNSLEEVTNAQVNAMFEPLDQEFRVFEGVPIDRR